MRQLFDIERRKKQGRKCTYKSSIEARSRNHRCRTKAISIIYSECVSSLSYPTSKAHVPYCVVDCGPSESKLCSKFHKRYDFRKKL